MAYTSSFFFKHCDDDEVAEFELVVLLGTDNANDPSTLLDPVFTYLLQFGALISKQAKAEFHRILSAAYLSIQLPPLHYWVNTQQLILDRYGSSYPDRHEPSTWEKHTLTLDPRDSETSDTITQSAVNATASTQTNASNSFEPRNSNARDTLTQSSINTPASIRTNASNSSSGPIGESLRNPVTSLVTKHPEKQKPTECPCGSSPSASLFEATNLPATHHTTTSPIHPFVLPTSDQVHLAALCETKTELVAAPPVIDISCGASATHLVPKHIERIHDNRPPARGETKPNPGAAIPKTVISTCELTIHPMREHMPVNWVAEHDFIPTPESVGKNQIIVNTKDPDPKMRAVKNGFDPLVGYLAGRFVKLKATNSHEKRSHTTSKLRTPWTRKRTIYLILNVQQNPQTQFNVISQLT